MELEPNSEPSGKPGEEQNWTVILRDLNDATLAKRLDDLRKSMTLVHAFIDSSKKTVCIDGDPAQMDKQKKSSAGRKNARLFRMLELSARILPLKVQSQAFEPAYYDVKAAYLKDRCQYHSKTARRWLRVCFILRVIVLFGQCLWGMCWETLKGRFVSFVLRRLFGG